MQIVRPNFTNQETVFFRNYRGGKSFWEDVIITMSWQSAKR